MTPLPRTALHRQEVARLRALDALAILGAAPAPALDALVRRVADATAAAAASLNLVTAQQVWSQAAAGPVARTTARATSHCAQVVATDAPSIVPCPGQPTPTGTAGATAYAYVGVPVRIDGLPVGTLCIFDAEAPSDAARLVSVLQDFAVVAEALLDARRSDARHPERRNAAAAERTDDALRLTARGEATQLLHDALDALPASVAVSDPTGRIVLANAGWQAQFGTVGPPGTASWPALVRELACSGHFPDAAGREEQFIAWRLGLAGANPTLHELRWRGGWSLVADRRLPSGHVVHLCVDDAARRHAEGEPLAMQRRQLDADAQLSAVLAAVPDLWFVIDARGRYSRVSAPRHPCLTRPFEQLLGQDLAVGLPTGAKEAAEAATQRARALNRVQRFEYELPHDDGSVRHYEARVSPMPGGELLYLTRDLTELRTLAREVQLMQRAFESPASLPIVIADAQADDLPLVYANTAFERLVGQSRDELAGRRFDCFAAGERPGSAALADALQRRGDVTVVVEGARRDGSRFVSEVSVVAVRDAGGRTTHLIGMLHDISERQQAEQARRDKIVAEMASRSKSEFMSRMSHEMRTPLNAIIGFAQLLRMQSGTRLDHVDHILDAGRHLLTLVNDVLDLQRAETGDLALKPEPVVVRPLIEDCVAMLQPMAEARGVRQRFDAPHRALAVRADAQRLRQVLLNIGSNAVKYNRPAGHVAWSVECLADGRCAITVEDTGAGMTADQLARLFQPFERLGRDTSSIEGTGLGLVIARRLVDAMGGSLEIESRPGAGTRMTVVLPPAAASETVGDAGAIAADAVSVSVAAPASPAASPLRLLYVEDNRINALLFEEALRRHPGFDLRVAEDGSEAIEVVQAWRPDVLVLDANLPGASGYELLRHLRQFAGLAQTPAYMCSADAMPEDVQRALDAGFRAYWTKPLDIDAVVDELHRVRRHITAMR